MLGQEDHDILVSALKEAFGKHPGPSLRVLMDSIPIMVFYIDLEEVCRMANKASCDYRGLSKDEVIGHHIKDVIGTELYLQTQDRIRCVLNSRTLKRTFQARRKTRTIQVWLTPDQDLKAEIIGCFCVFAEVMRS